MQGGALGGIDTLEATLNRNVTAGVCTAKESGVSSSVATGVTAGVVWREAALPVWDKLVAASRRGLTSSEIGLSCRR